MKYFRLKDDIYADDHSELGDIKFGDDAIDADMFTTALRYNYDESQVHSIDGEFRGDFDFNLASFDVPIVSKRFAQLFQTLGREVVQLIPLQSPCNGELYILNVLSRIPALDESRSLFTKWEASDGRPDRMGQYRMVAELKVDPHNARGNDVFRIEGWDVPLIVSERLVNLAQEQGMKGCVYELTI